MSQHGSLENLYAIRRKFANANARITNLMDEYLTTYLSGGFSHLDDDLYSTMILNIAAWLSEKELDHKHTHTIAYLLMMDQWGADSSKVIHYLNLSKAEMVTMTERLKRNRLIQNGRLIHPWYDHVGNDLKKQILIYAAVMLDMIDIQSALKHIKK